VAERVPVPVTLESTVFVWSVVELGCTKLVTAAALEEDVVKDGLCATASEEVAEVVCEATISRTM